MERFHFFQQSFGQAAIIIRELGIRSFDYSRAGKRGKTANIEEHFINLSLTNRGLNICGSKFLRTVTPHEERGKPVLCLVLYCYIL